MLWEGSPSSPPNHCRTDRVDPVSFDILFSRAQRHIPCLALCKKSNNMAKAARTPANSFVAAVRKVYNPIGFSKGYNFILFFITMG